MVDSGGYIPAVQQHCIVGLRFVCRPELAQPGTTAAIPRRVGLGSHLQALTPPGGLLSLPLWCLAVRGVAEGLPHLPHSGTLTITQIQTVYYFIYYLRLSQGKQQTTYIVVRSYLATGDERFNNNHNMNF